MNRKFHYDRELKRVVEGPAPVSERAPVDRPFTSDTLGFGQSQLAEMEAHRDLSGMRDDVEFVPDPDVPEFRQVRCRNREAFIRYAGKRGYVDKTSIGGVRLTPEELSRAEELARRQYGGP